MTEAICLAELEISEGIYFWNRSNSRLGDVILVVGAILLVSFLAYVWVAFFRQRRRKRKHRYPSAQTVPETERSHSHSHSRRRHRRTHRSHRPTNPTLAQAGGLPPLRPKDQPPPPP